MQTLKRRATEPPVSLRQTAPEIPEPLDAVVLRCLQPQREARFQTTAELVHALDLLEIRCDRGLAKPLEAAPLVGVDRLLRRGAPRLLGGVAHRAVPGGPPEALRRAGG